MPVPRASVANLMPMDATRDGQKPSSIHRPSRRIAIVVVGLVVISFVLTIAGLAVMREHDREHDGVGGHLSGDFRPAAADTPDPQGWWGAALSEPLEVRPFTLTDQHGEPRSFPIEGARVTLLYFGYTHCPDVCPGTMATITEAIRRLDPAAAPAVEVVFVTTDPARDTEDRLAEWLALFDPSFIGLTGPAGEIRSVQTLYGVPGAERRDLGGGAYESVHVDEVLAFGADGLARRAYAPDTTPGALAADLERMLDEGP